jgi:hypothetical protein
MDSIDQRRIRAAENQALMRSVNDRIDEINRTFADFTPYGSWVCECADIACVERIDMTLAEYEEVRSLPERFAVAPDGVHVIPDVETVTVKTDRYWIVEKFGAGAERAAELADT